MELPAAIQKPHVYTAAGIFAIALLVRIFHIHFLRSTVFFEHPIHDAGFYHEQALSIASGNWMGHRAYFMGPLYSYFLALMYFVSSGSKLFALVVQSILGAGTCVIVFLIGRDIFSNKVGVIAALVAGTYGVLIFYDGLLLMETTALFLNMLCLLGLVRAAHTGKLAYVLAAGLCLGFSALGRASILLFGLGAVIVILFKYPWPKRQRVLAGLIFVAAVLAIVLPVTIRNYSLEGDFVLISANGGLNFYIGNGPGANGTYRILTDSNVAPGDMIGRFRAEIASGRQLTLSETSRWWYRQAVDYARDHPWVFLRNLFWKVYLFWNTYEIPQLEWYSAARGSSPILSLPLVTSRLVIPLAVLGIIVGMRYMRRAPIVLVYLTAQTLAISLFFVTGRYRITVLPVLTVCAAYGSIWLLRTLRRHRWRPALLSIVGLGAILWVTDPARLRLDMDELRRWNMISLALRHAETTTELRQAVALLDEAASEFHSDADTRKHYGVVLRRAGHLDESVMELKAASTLRPDDPVIYFQLGKTFALIGDDSLAEEFLLAAISLAPFYKEAHEHLATEYARQGRYGEALAAYSSAVEIDPTDSRLRLNLGVTYGVLNRPLEAIRQLELAVQYDTANWRARYNLAIAFAGIGRVADARRELEIILESQPDYEPARRAITELPPQSPD